MGDGGYSAESPCTHRSTRKSFDLFAEATLPCSAPMLATQRQGRGRKALRNLLMTWIIQPHDGSARKSIQALRAQRSEDLRRAIVELLPDRRVGERQPGRLDNDLVTRLHP